MTGRPATFRSTGPILRQRLNVFALVMVCASLTASPSLGDGQADPVAVVSSQPGSIGISANTGNPEIRARLYGADLEVAGVQLRRDLLGRLYAAHGFEPIWETRQAQAASLWNAILHADEHGLDPNAFHASLIGRVADRHDRDLLLSDAFLTYADALARGAVPVEHRSQVQSLKPDPADVVAVLQAAMAAADPASLLNALAPKSPAYTGLRQAYRYYRYVGDTERARRIAVNLERLRWLPRSMPSDRIEVNTANAELRLFRGNVPVFATRVVVGETDKQTPEFQASIESILFNPPWYVPRSIVAKEILPKLHTDPGYLARHGMVMQSNGSIVQHPGPHSSLGQLKFEMPNRFDVYLHDTPLKGLFVRDNRRQSHGCVRVQNPRELAALLLQEEVASINNGIELNYTHRQHLPKPLPVFIVYQTVVTGPNGSIGFLDDMYHRDDEISNGLRAGPSAVVSGLMSGFGTELISRRPRMAQFALRPDRSPGATD